MRRSATEALAWFRATGTASNRQRLATRSLMLSVANARLIVAYMSWWRTRNLVEEEVNETKWRNERDCR